MISKSIINQMLRTSQMNIGDHKILWLRLFRLVVPIILMLILASVTQPVFAETVPLPPEDPLAVINTAESPSDGTPLTCDPAMGDVCPSTEVSDPAITTPVDEASGSTEFDASSLINTGTAGDELDTTPATEVNEGQITDPGTPVDAAPPDLIVEPAAEQPLVTPAGETEPTTGEPITESDITTPGSVPAEETIPAEQEPLLTIGEGEQPLADAQPALDSESPTAPTGADVEAETAALEEPTETNAEKNSTPNLDPYFYRNTLVGTETVSVKYSFLLAGCDEDDEYCVESPTPIQAAIDDVKLNGMPDDGTIYLDEGDFEEAFEINGFTSAITLECSSW